MPRVSVIIIHWNTPELLKKQLTLLTPGSDELEILVIDNFSDQEARKKLSALSSSVTRMVFNSTNLGFAAAGNIGAQLAKGEWLLFLNPDVLITPSEIEQFISEATRLNFVAASPATTDPRYTKPIPSSASLITEFTPLHRIIPLSVFRTKTLTGGCLLINKGIFEKVGKWDEDFFLWFEDSDLTKRLVDNGYAVGQVDIAVSHQGGASFTILTEKERRSMFFRSMNTYATKHFSYFGKRMIELLSARFT